MNVELLEQSLLDTRIMPVIRAGYSLEPVSGEGLVDIAQKVNSDFGYELFDDMSEEKLRADFILITEIVTKYLFQDK